MTGHLTVLFARRAELLRELATIDERIGGILEGALAPAPTSDGTLTLEEAARLLGEPPETFRRRLEFRKALVSRPGERRLRYSRSKLEGIRLDRLEASDSRSS